MKNREGKPVQVTNCGELGDFDIPPTERDFIITLLCYSNTSPRYWGTGPSGFDEEQVLNSLGSYTNLEAVRIYRVKVPR